MSETIQLKQIAHGRSGDKGNHANIGIIGFTPTGFDYLRDVLTDQLVFACFKSMGATKMERFELPGIGAYNFFLHNVLAGGASQSLRIGSQGKTLALALLELEIPCPPNLKAMTM